MAPRFITVDSADPILPDLVIDATQGTTSDTVAAGDLTTELHHTFTDKPDGALGTADTGQTYFTAGSPMTIVDGVLRVMGAVGAPGYVDTLMGGKVTRCGVRFKYPTGATTTSGNIGLLAWANSITVPPTPPDSPFHASIDIQKGSWSVWENQVYQDTPLLSEHYYKFGDVAPPVNLTAEVVYTIEAFIEDDTVTVVYPDGYISVVSDPRVAALDGFYAGWEITQGADGEAYRPQIVEWWATAAPDKPYSTAPIGSIVRTIKAAAQVGSSPTRTLYTTPGTYFYTVPDDASWADVTLVGAGGGGQSGERRASGVASLGGNGGQGGGRTKSRIWLVPLRGTLLQIVAPAGGAGGAAVTTNNTAGNNGSAGENAAIVAVTPSVVVVHAQGGGAGGALAGSGYAWGTVIGGNGGSASGTGLGGGTGAAPDGNTFVDGTGGGGAGGGITSANLAAAGGGGGFGQLSVSSTAGFLPGSGGAVNTVGGNATSHGADILAVIDPPGGCGPGGGGASTSGAGGAGGVGGKHGAGGAGGGASRDGNNSGPGSAGADGAVLLVVI